MDHENLRKEIRNINENFGIKYIYIAEKMGIDNSTLSHFLNNDRNFSKKTIDKIENYVLQNTYKRD